MNHVVNLTVCEMTLHICIMTLRLSLAIRNQNSIFPGVGKKQLITEVIVKHIFPSHFGPFLFISLLQNVHKI